MIKYLSSELIIIKKYLSYLFERFKEDRIIVYSGYLSFVT
ncbi:MAG TPA: virulence factor BrkB family protein, partial [Candidatus Lambdaproteobacteria bacterium]|nr:virulence factor BrkB family protein [Candidatus Lambdaproteobacteria bacterium]